MILDDSDPDSPFSHRIRQQIHATLDQQLQEGYAIYTEFLYLGHFSETHYDATLKAYLKRKYLTNPVSLIIAIGAGALKFSLNLRANAWPQTPIVFKSFDAMLPTGPIPPNTTGIISPRRFRDLVKAARLLVPGLTQIALVGDAIERQPYRRHYRQELQSAAKSSNISI